MTSTGVKNIIKKSISRFSESKKFSVLSHESKWRTITETIYYDKFVARTEQTRSTRLLFLIAGISTLIHVFIKGKKNTCEIIFFK